jgi:hypothetical protein
MTHTPGPWNVETVKTSIGHAHKITPTNTCIYVDHRNESERDEKTRTALANARLIAAAPDLLAALRKLVPADFDNHPQDFMPEWHKARAAIIKATG